MLYYSPQVSLLTYVGQLKFSGESLFMDYPVQFEPSDEVESEYMAANKAKTVHVWLCKSPGDSEVD